MKISLKIYFPLIIVLLYGKAALSRSNNKVDECVNYNIYPQVPIKVQPSNLRVPSKYKIEDYDWTYELRYRNRTKYKSDISKWIHPNDQSVNELLIPEYQLIPNTYYVIIRAKNKDESEKGDIYLPWNSTYVTAEKKTRYKIENYKECKLTMTAWALIAVISGGNERIVPARQEIVVNGRESLDLNMPGKIREGATFKWNCKQKTTPYSFCTEDVISTKSQLIIPADKVESGDEFTITLSVNDMRYIRGNLHFGKENQKIIVVSGASELSISCTQNCPPASYNSKSNQVTSFKVECLSNCDDIKDEDYFWTVEISSSDINFDYEKNSRFGQTGKKFVIEKNAIEAGGRFKVTVELKSATKKTGKASSLVYFDKPATISRCSLDPPSGEAKKTQYTVVCEGTQNFPLIYELVLKDQKNAKEERVGNGTLVKLLNGSQMIDLNNNKFILPPTKEKEIVLRLTGILKGDSEELVEGEVKLPNKTDENSNNNKTSLNLADMATEMLKRPIRDLEEVMNITDSLTFLLDRCVLKENDPQLSNLVTTVCNKVVQKTLEIAKNTKNISVIKDNLQNVTRTISNCLAIKTRQDLNYLPPLKVTTLAPSLDYLHLTENYPNYEEFKEDFFKDLEFMKETTHNIVNGSATVAKLMAMHVQYGELFVKIEGPSRSTGVAKNSGKKLTNITFNSNNVSLVLTEDFVEDEHFYDVLVSTWTTNIFSWSPTKIQIITNIINFEIWHTICKAQETNFTKPFNIYFNVIVNANTSDNMTTRNSFIVPENYASLSSSDLNFQIKSHLVGLPKEVTLFINFQNISSNSSFEVVFVFDVLPTVKHFSKSVKVNANKHFFTIINQKSYKRLLYVGILPDRSTYKSGSGKKMINYEIRLTLRTCIRWIVPNSKWIKECQIGNKSNVEVLHCQCRYPAIYAGYKQSVNSLIKIVIKPDIELELSRNLVIFLTVSTIFTIYCFFLLLAFRRKKKILYFLADNTASHRFVYLLYIKTGAHFRSGTTSNVIIKIIGDKKSTEAHVLNYPDPQLRLLQRFGKDVFVLTAKDHLGNLKQIELWFDSIGPSPRWYCKEVKIYDLQLRKEWLFKVNKRFSVLKKTTFVVVESTTKENFEDKQDFQNLEKNIFTWKFSLKYHNWLFWKDEGFLNFSKKISLLVCTILGTLSLCVVVYGVPDFQMMDVFDEDSFHVEDRMVLIGFLVSLPPFFFQCTIAWYLRLSRLNFENDEQKKAKSFKLIAVCWVIVSILIVFCVTFLILVGFWVPFIKSLLCLTLCGIGLGFDIFVNEIVLILILGFRKKKVFNMWEKFNDIWDGIERHRRYLYTQFGEYVLRPYFKHLYTPLDPKDIKVKKIEFKKRLRVVSDFHDLIMFFIYVVMLYVVALANKDSLISNANRDLFYVMDGTHTRTPSFEKILTIHDIYRYLNHTLIPILHPIGWYGNYVISEPALMIDLVNKFIGVARIKQNRVRRNACEVVEQMRFLNTPCIPEFQPKYMETRTFGYKWSRYSKFLIYDRMRNMWKYTKVNSSEKMISFSEVSSFSNGAYMGFLGRTLYNSYVNFRNIFKNIWVDARTRVIFIEFLTYNVDFNVFSSVRLLFEQSATGITYKTIQVTTVRMLFIDNEAEHLSAVFFVLFVTWVALLSIRISLGTLRNFRKIYKDLWFTIDVILIFLSLTCIVLFFLRTTMIGFYLKSMEQARHNEFISYFYLFHLEFFLTLTAAILVCLATIRLWKFLRFILFFRIMERTLLLSAGPLLTFTLTIFLISFTFSMATVLIIGNHFDRVHSWIKTATLLSISCFQPVDLKLGELVGYPLASLYLTVYAVIIKVSLFISISVLITAYMKAALDISSKPETYTIKNYVRELSNYFPKYMKYKCLRLKAGQTDLEKVKQKPDKFIYMNSISTPKNYMALMKSLAQSVLRNRKQYRKTTELSRDDYKLMLNVFRNFLKEKEKKEDRYVFFKGHVQQQRIKFIPEKRLEMIANVVNYLLQENLHFDHRQSVYGESPSLECIRKIKAGKAALNECCLNLQLVFHQMKAIEVLLKKNYPSS